MHTFRRFAAVLALTLPLVALVAPSPAQAAMCTTDVQLYPPSPYDPPPAHYPCPNQDDQPVGAPVWVSTEYGPGYNMSEWQFVKVTQGGHIFLTNATVSSPGARFYGAGFDSGYVPQGGVREVAGVPSLAVGEYRIYDDRNAWVGDLYVVPPTQVGTCC